MTADVQTASTPSASAFRPSSPELVLGTMTFADTVDEATARRILDAALDEGVTRVDTANAYAGGATETMLATLLHGRRDRIELASKAGMPHPDAGTSGPLSATALRNSVEASLRRLGTDRLDLLYLHQPDRRTPLEETLATVAKLHAEGKVLSLGVSNFAAWQIADVERAAANAGAPTPVVAQQLYNLVARRIEEEYLEFAGTHRLATMVYNPLGGGLLTGKHRFSESPTDGRFGDSKLAAMYTERYWNEQLFAAITSMTALADDAGLPLVEVALRWVAHRQGVASLLLGGSREAQIRDNIASIRRGPLPTAIVEELDRVGARLRGPMPAYNR